MKGPWSRNGEFTIRPRFSGVDQSENFGVSAPTSEATTTTSAHDKLTARTFLLNRFSMFPPFRPTKEARFPLTSPLGKYRLCFASEVLLQRYGLRDARTQTALNRNALRVDRPC